MNANCILAANILSTKSGARIAGLAALVLFLVGILAPVIQIQPNVNPHPFLNAALKIMFRVDGRPTDHPILKLIADMFGSGLLEKIIGTLLLLFSVIFPLAKLCVLTFALFGNSRARESVVTGDWFKVLVLWSMLDIFVAALGVVVVKHIPGGSKVILRFGTAAFLASILMSLLATKMAKKAWLQESALSLQSNSPTPAADCCNYSRSRCRFIRSRATRELLPVEEHSRRLGLPIRALTDNSIPY